MAIKLIKDPIHGNIIFSKFEELFFQNPLLNRLHGILQNSMAYRVYPSAKASRFSHSIGVMHVASDIFKYGIANGSENTVISYFNKVQTLLFDNIFTQEYYPELCLYKIENTYKGSKNKVFTKLSKSAPLFFGEEYISHVAGYRTLFINNKQVFPLYLILQQAVRIIGLTHDIGHLPFSHLSEFSLDYLFLDLKERSKPLNDNEQYILNILEKILPEEGQLHEAIGDNLIQYLFERNIDTVHKSELAEEDKLAFFIYNKLIYKCIEMIKSGKSEGELSSLFSIVSSDLDADRLDFVLRDGLHSGLITQTGDIERIIKMFCLCKVSHEGVISDYGFYPAIQSMNDIQEILFDRFRIYKYMVNHHKVKKLDYVVSYALYLQMLTELDQVDSLKGHSKIGTEISIDILRIASEVTDFDKNFERKTHLFLQLSDSWMFSILNHTYIGLLIKTQSKLNKREKELQLLLSEIFTGEKEFSSLWKRDEEYLEFVEDCVSHLSQPNLVIDLESIQSKDIIPNKAKIQINAFLDNTNTSSVKFHFLLEFLFSKQKYWTSLLQTHLRRKNIYSLVSPKKIKSGISDLSLVDLKNHDKVVSFKNVSRMSKIIDYEIYNSIHFFVYFKNNIQHSVPNINEHITKEITIFINQQLLKFIKEHKSNV
ncbi:hypothetical protein HQ531_06045 [bacterium]|nr:hypothetical protein [bacterium]